MDVQVVAQTNTKPGHLYVEVQDMTDGCYVFGRLIWAGNNGAFFDAECEDEPTQVFDVGEQLVEQAGCFSKRYAE